MTLPPALNLGTDYILDALVEEGPCATCSWFRAAWSIRSCRRSPGRRKLTPVVAAHEGGAVYMADGYARAGGSFGAALGIGGPGCCNMATAVAAAKTDGSPVLV